MRNRLQMLRCEIKNSWPVVLILLASIYAVFFFILVRLANDPITATLKPDSQTFLLWRFTYVAQEFIPLFNLLLPALHLWYWYDTDVSEGLLAVTGGKYNHSWSILLILLFEGALLLPGLIWGFLKGYNFIWGCLLILSQTALLVAVLYGLTILLRSVIVPMLFAEAYCLYCVTIGNGLPGGLYLCLLQPFGPINTLEQTSGKSLIWLIFLTSGIVLIVLLGIWESRRRRRNKRIK